MSFSSVVLFEQQVAEYFGAPYAVATDCCTHAIELCLRHTNIKSTSCPSHTYVSIPMTLTKLAIDWSFNEETWNDYYQFPNTSVIDAAVLWKPNSYIPNTFMCVSFQYKKHLSLGRGGIILCDSISDKEELIKMAYDGRHRDTAWANQPISQMGYHYYMTPETAQLGLDKLSNAINTPAKKWKWSNYPDLSTMPVFSNK